MKVTVKIVELLEQLRKESFRLAFDLDLTLKKFMNFVTYITESFLMPI